MWVEALERSQPTSIPTWADGTDAEIANALTRHYNGEIDLTDYWSVGDERVVHLSAIAATTYVYAQPEQDVTLVLVNVGGRTLTSPINGHTECAFVVGQKDCLSGTGQFRGGSTTAYTYLGWGGSGIRTWLNSDYINALPATLGGIFKSHAIPYCSTYNDATISTDNSIVGLPAGKEVQGTNISSDKVSSSYNQLAYYQDSSNRIKKVSGTATNYWTNSKYYTTNSDSTYRKYVFTINTNGERQVKTSDSYYGIAPQMVI